ncbi:uncharacterized protein LOC133202535 [Saccostrea echinata]|uniref:uncharacterized protein LOC133202535 n=1 Tax=Saccostrea echinata TaxID=191078 RepID=UPI002A823B30|nr:uncharacterized protein LOC133202535 [Saccostrea echinata]
MSSWRIRFHDKWPHMSSLYSGGSTREDEDEKYMEQVTVFDNVYENPSEPYGAYKFYMAPREEFVIQSEPHLYPARAMYKEDDERTSGYATSGGSSTFRDGSTRRILLCVFLIFLLIGAIIAAVTMAVLISHQRKTKPLKPDSQQQRVLESNIRIANRTYIPEYSDPNSKGYQILEAEFCEAIDAMFLRGDSPMKDNYKGCKVLSFRYGSVIARYLLTFILNDKKPVGTVVDEVENFLKETIPKKGIWNPLLLDGKIVNFYPVEITKLDSTARPPVIKTTPRDVGKKIVSVSKGPPVDVSRSPRMDLEIDSSTDLPKMTTRKEDLSKVYSSLEKDRSVEINKMSRLSESIDIQYPSKSSIMYKSEMPASVSSSSKISTPNLDLLLTGTVDIFDKFLLSDSNLHPMSSVKHKLDATATTDTGATVSRVVRFDPSLQAEIDRVLGAHLPSASPLSEQSIDFSSSFEIAQPDLKISQTPSVLHIESTEEDLSRTVFIRPSQIKHSSITVEPFTDDFFGFLFQGSPSSRNPTDFPSRFEIGDPHKNTADNLFSDGGFGGFLFPQPNIREPSEGILPPNIFMLPTQSVYMPVTSIYDAKVSSEQKGFSALDSEIRSSLTAMDYEKTVGKLPPNQSMLSSHSDSFTLTTSMHETQTSQRYAEIINSDYQSPSSVSSIDLFRETSSKIDTSLESRLKTDGFLKVQLSTELRNTDLPKTESVTFSQTISPSASVLQSQGSSEKTVTPAFSGIITDIPIDTELQGVFDNFYNVKSEISPIVSKDYSLLLNGPEKTSAASAGQEGLLTVINRSLSGHLQSSELVVSSFQSEYINTKIFSDSTLSKDKSKIFSATKYEDKSFTKSLLSADDFLRKKTEVLFTSSKETSVKLKNLNIDTMPSTIILDKIDILPTSSAEYKTDVDASNQRASSGLKQTPSEMNLILMSGSKTEQLHSITSISSSQQILLPVDSGSGLPFEDYAQSSLLSLPLLASQIESERSLISKPLYLSQSTKFTDVVPSHETTTPMFSEMLPESVLEKELQSVFNKFDNLKSIILPIDQTGLTISSSKQDKASVNLMSEQEVGTIDTMMESSAFELSSFASGDRKSEMLSDTIDTSGLFSTFGHVDISLQSQFHSQSIQETKHLFSTSYYISETSNLFHIDNTPLVVPSKQIQNSLNLKATDNLISETSLFKTEEFKLHSEEWKDSSQFSVKDDSFISTSHSDSLIHSTQAVLLVDSSSVSEVHQNTEQGLKLSEMSMSALKSQVISRDFSEKMPSATLTEQLSSSDVQQRTNLDFVPSEISISSIKSQSIKSESISGYEQLSDLGGMLWSMSEVDHSRIGREQSSTSAAVHQSSELDLIPSEIQMSERKLRTMIFDSFSRSLSLQPTRLGAEQSSMSGARQSSTLDLMPSEIRTSQAMISEVVSENVQSLGPEQLLMSDVYQSAQLDLMRSEMSTINIKSQSLKPESSSEYEQKSALGTIPLSMSEVVQSTLGWMRSEITKSNMKSQTFKTENFSERQNSILKAKQTSLYDTIFKMEPSEYSILNSMSKPIYKDFSRKTQMLMFGEEQFSTSGVYQSTKLELMPSMIQMSDRKSQTMILGSMEFSGLGTEKSTMNDAHQSSIFDLTPIEMQTSNRKSQATILEIASENVQLSTLGAEQSSVSDVYQSTALGVMPSRTLFSDRNLQAIISKDNLKKIQLSTSQQSLMGSVPLDSIPSDILMSDIKSQTINLGDVSEVMRLSKSEQTLASNIQLGTVRGVSSEIPISYVTSHTMLHESISENVQVSDNGFKQFSLNNFHQSSVLNLIPSEQHLSDVKSDAIISENLSKSMELSTFGAEQSLLSDIQQGKSLELNPSGVAKPDIISQTMVSNILSENEVRGVVSSGIPMSHVTSRTVLHESISMSVHEFEQSAMNNLHQSSVLNLMPSEQHMSDVKSQVIISENLSRNMELSTLIPEQSLLSDIQQSTSLELMPFEVTKPDMISQAIVSNVLSESTVRSVVSSEIPISHVTSYTMLHESEKVQMSVHEFEQSSMNNLHQSSVLNLMPSEQQISDVKSQLIISKNLSRSMPLSTLVAEQSLQSDIQQSTTFELLPSKVAMPDVISQSILSNILSEKAHLSTYRAEHSLVGSVLESFGSTTDELLKDTLNIITQPSNSLLSDSKRTSLHLKSSDSFYTSVKDAVNSEEVVDASVMTGPDKDFKTMISDPLSSVGIPSHLTNILDSQSSMLHISDGFTNKILTSSNYLELLNSDFWGLNSNVITSVSSRTATGITTSPTISVQFSDPFTRSSSYTASRFPESFIFESGLAPTTTALSFATDSVFNPVQPLESEMWSSDATMISPTQAESLNPSLMNTEIQMPLAFDSSQIILSSMKKENDSFSLESSQFDSYITTNLTMLDISPTHMASYLPSLMNNAMQSVTPLSYYHSQNFLFDVRDQSDSNYAYDSGRATNPTTVYVSPTQVDSYLPSIMSSEIQSEMPIEQTTPYDPSQDFLFDTNETNDSLNLGPQVINPNTTDILINSPPYFDGSSVIFTTIEKSAQSGLHVLTTQSSSLEHSNASQIYIDNVSSISDMESSNEFLKHNKSDKTVQNISVNGSSELFESSPNGVRDSFQGSSISTTLSIKPSTTVWTSTSFPSLVQGSSSSNLHVTDLTYVESLFDQTLTTAPHSNIPPSLSTYTNDIVGSIDESLVKNKGITNFVSMHSLKENDQAIHALSSFKSLYVSDSQTNRNERIMNKESSDSVAYPVLRSRNDNVVTEALVPSFTSDYSSKHTHESNIAIETLSPFSVHDILYPHEHFSLENLRSSYTDYIDDSYFEISLNLESLTQLSVNIENDRSSDVSSNVFNLELQTIFSPSQFSGYEYQEQTIGKLSTKTPSSVTSIGTFAMKSSISKFSTNEVSKSSFFSKIISSNSDQKFTATPVENVFKFDSPTPHVNEMHRSSMPFTPLLQTDISNINIHTRLSEYTRSSFLENSSGIYPSLIDKSPSETIQKSSPFYRSTKSTPFTSKSSNTETSPISSFKKVDATADNVEFMNSSSLDLGNKLITKTSSSFAQNTIFQTLTDLFRSEHLSQFPQNLDPLLSSHEKTEHLFRSNHATQFSNSLLNSNSNKMQTNTSAFESSERNPVRQWENTIPENKVINTVTGERLHLATSTYISISSLFDMSDSENKNLPFSQNETDVGTLIISSDVKSSKKSKSHSSRDHYLFTAANDYDYYATDLDFVTDNIDVTVTSSVESSTIAPSPTKSDSLRFSTLSAPLNPYLLSQNSYRSVSSLRTTQNVGEMGSLGSLVRGVPIILPDTTESRETQKDRHISSNNSPPQNNAIISTQSYLKSPSHIHSSQTTQIISSLQRFPQIDVTMTTPLITKTEQHLTSSIIPIFPDDPFAGFFGSGPAIPQWVLDMLGSVHESPKSSVNHFFRH